MGFAAFIDDPYGTDCREVDPEDTSGPTIHHEPETPKLNRHQRRKLAAKSRKEKKVFKDIRDAIERLM